MNWARDWVYNVIKPFLAQLKNRLDNIKVEKITNGFKFYNAENVTTNIDMTKDILSLSSNLGHVNPNPYFFKGDLDYTDYINGDTRNIVNDIIYKYPKSLYVKGNGGGIIGTEFFHIDQSLEYRATCAVRAKNPDGKPNDGTASVSYYVGVACYDVDKNLILPQHLTTNPGSGGVVVGNVSKGGTIIKVKGDFSKWYNGSAAHERSFRVHKLRPDGTYGYIGSSGTYYDELGYTRDTMYIAWDENGLTDNGDGTFNIKLNKGCTLDIPNGSKICNSYSGSAYNYWISNKSSPIDGKTWDVYSSPWIQEAPETPDAQGYVGANYGGVIRNGSTYYKLYMMPNYYYYENGTYIGKVYAVNADLEVWYGEVALQFRYKQ